MGDFLRIYAEHSHTRFPVYEGETENVVGIVSAKDVLRSLSAGAGAAGGPVTDVVRDALFVPETKRVAELFDELRGSGRQMAIVVDEFGGLAGLVTLKRLLEELAGPVGEEGQAPEEEYRSIDEFTFLVDGAMSLQEANEELGLRLPGGAFETVAGFVLDGLGHIPREGEHLESAGARLEVLSMRNLKIETLRLTKLDAGHRPERG